MNMALKLLIIICQNLQGNAGTLALIQSLLSQQLLEKALTSSDVQDPKLKEIGVYLVGLIYPQQEESKEAANAESAQDSSGLSEDEIAKKKKAAAARKKQQLIAKMKAKQASKLPTAFTDKIAGVQVEESKDAVPMEVDTLPKAEAQELACASCQEQIAIDAFYARPFVQLCYLNASKALYYTYHQTYESQLKSLKNLKAATVAITDGEEEKKQS